MILSGCCAVVAGHGSGYAGGALYGAGATPAYAPYDDQIMRSTLPHHMVTSVSILF